MKAWYWFLVNRGVLSVFWHLCGWEQTTWPLTPLWLSHLSIAGGTTAPDPIMDFIPGEDVRHNLLPCLLSSSHLSFILSLLLSSLYVLLFHSPPSSSCSLSPPVLLSSLNCAVTFKVEVNHFTGRYIRINVPVQGCQISALIQPMGPIIQCHQLYWLQSQRTMKLTSVGINGFFIAPVHK